MKEITRTREVKVSRKNYKTHIEILSNKFNLGRENVIYYAKNHNLSENMTKRLLKKWDDDYMQFCMNINEYNS